MQLQDERDKAYQKLGNMSLNTDHLDSRYVLLSTVSCLAIIIDIFIQLITDQAVDTVWTVSVNQGCEQLNGPCKNRQ